MDKKISELFIPGPAGRIETKYFKNDFEEFAEKKYTVL